MIGKDWPSEIHARFGRDRICSRRHQDDLKQVFSRIANDFMHIISPEFKRKFQVDKDLQKSWQVPSQWWNSCLGRTQSVTRQSGLHRQFISQSTIWRSLTSKRRLPVGTLHRNVNGMTLFVPRKRRRCTSRNSTFTCTWRWWKIRLRYCLLDDCMMSWGVPNLDKQEETQQWQKTRKSSRAAPTISFLSSLSLSRTYVKLTLQTRNRWSLSRPIVTLVTLTYVLFVL